MKHTTSESGQRVQRTIHVASWSKQQEVEKRSPKKDKRLEVAACKYIALVGSGVKLSYRNFLHSNECTVERLEHQYGSRTGN